MQWIEGDYPSHNYWFFFLFFISDKINNLMNYAIKNNVNNGREKDKWNYMHTGVDRFCKSLRTTAETQGIVPKVSLDSLLDI